MAGPLQNIRVLDLTRVLAGPWSTQILADFGAEVIKIEKPGEGDDTRGWGPPFLTNPDGSRGDAAYYLSANRGKQSVAIDMAKPEGQKLLQDLARNSDVVMENFKVGGLKKYGLDYESLKAINPKLIYCSITGFGQTGPYAQRAGYDFMIQGMGGIMSITGQPDGTPGAEPVKTGVAFADVFTGLYATIGVLAALHHRDKTGEGQYLDLALLDSQVAVLANQALNFLVGGKAPKRLGNAHPNIVPYQTFATADGFVIIAVGNDRQFREYTKIAGVPEVAQDPRFLTNSDRVGNREALIALLVEPMKQRKTAEWIAALEAAAVPCGPINTIDQVFADPQVEARGLNVTLARADGTKTPGVANPVRFSATPIEYSTAPPALGNATEEVLRRVLGLTPEQVGKLRDSASIG
ncbi:CaiB/BaiF CoA transferase family protein [Aestuariivirga sp. YIM B02566]|uniref:CoA transferase n=1 Tax=Taklimakanibacter albus TaxID=2800327 RepID=A0ACC5R9A0_9HYPH|nr:CaiB/BaiF CoA-transferase family protein [Aestuariivirga sp. YIM B02566]MBK1869239.1 CoA transferase [Aestuariivirga sp. YIM B02566]